MYKKTVMYVQSCCFVNLRPCPHYCVFKSMRFVVIDNTSIDLRPHFRFHAFSTVPITSSETQGRSVGREKRRDEGFQAQAEKPLGTDSHRTILNGQANVGSWLGTKNALYYCTQSANSIPWVLFVQGCLVPGDGPHIAWLAFSQQHISCWSSLWHHRHSFYVHQRQKV